MKKKLIILTAVFLLFLIPGLLFNTQRGLYFGNDFWRKTDGGYVCGSDRIVPSDTSFALTLNGKEMSVAMTAAEDGAYRFDFSDGTALEFTQDNVPYTMISVGSTLLYSSGELILTDVDHPSLTYAHPADTVVEYYYDESGTKVGEAAFLSAENGETIGMYEWFYADGERPAEPEPILLYDGVRLNYDDLWNSRYVNADGEYLLNAQDLFYIRTDSYSSIGKSPLVRLLLDMREGEAEARGVGWVALLYALVYWIGAATLLWPEEMAFFGSRWRYSTEPELSDDGLMFQYIGGVIAMIGSVVLLFMPLFM